MNRPIVFGSIRGAQVNDPRLEAPPDPTLSNVVKLGKAGQWRPVADAREWAERRARVNDDLWLHADAEPDDHHAEHDAPDHGDWWLWAIIIAAVVTAWALLVLSCGLRADGGCWK